ncbi:polymorphic toxin-type HINT domain-containing protein [Dactylosporangium sp. NPDC048998]|uniref:polymorphic toxin-type HINT domain-containing protein n=1 Tax=Dactylosporangium sp. NPDC048998 TaxID=3363976 RepID=UPI00371E72C3
MDRAIPIRPHSRPPTPRRSGARRAVVVIATLIAAQLPAIGPASAAAAAGHNNTLAAPAAPLQVAEQAPGLPGLLAPASTSAVPATPVDYAYDAAGQLRGVTQSGTGGQSARYDYDQSGNLLSIARSASSALTVTSVVPAQAAAGASVTISGTSFATTPAGNTVRFNGTAATVTSASATRLVVTVPAGATTGTVSVTTTAGTATSAQAFTVVAATPAPTVTSFTPASAAAGTAVTITGTGFSTTAAANTVTFGRTRATVTVATATSLTVTVPLAAGSGRITVAAAGGSATSGTDFVAVPGAFSAASVATTGVLSIDGTPSTVSVATAGKIAVLGFDGTKGQKLSLGLTGSTFTGDLAILGYTPYSGSFSRDQYDSPYYLSKLAGGLALPDLPFSGTYQIVLAPLGTATGSVTATLSSRVTGSLNLTGTGTTVNLTRAGQQAELTFNVTAGQYIGLGLTGSTLASGRITTQIKEPNGTPLLWNSADLVHGSVLTQGDEVEFTAAMTGTYRLIFGASDAGTGSLTVTGSLALDAGVLTVGAAKTVSVTRPGQNSRMTFSGTAGQRLTFTMWNYTFTYLPYVTVLNPDNSVLSAASMNTLTRDLPVLPSTGTYTIIAGTASSTGSYTASLTQRQNAGTITTTGSAATLTVAQPGQAADVGFTATAGQHLDLGFTGWTFGTGAQVVARVYDPSGNQVVGYLIGNVAAFNFTAPVTGTYRLTLTTNDGSTGSSAVTLSQEVAGGAVGVGGTTTAISSTRPGQSIRLSFTGAASQRLSLVLTGYTYPHGFELAVIKPDGTVLRDALITELEVDLDPLPAAGTYQVLVQPFAETGASTLLLAERLNAGTATVGGAALAMPVSSAGRYAEVSFTASAGQRLCFGLTSWTFATTGVRFRLVNASGTGVLDGTIGNGNSVDYIAPAAGTYRLLIGATDFSTGSVTLTLSQQIDGGTMTLNSAVTVNAPRAGQSTHFSYAGTAGQLLQIAYGTVTMPYYPFVTVRNPDGTVLASLSGAATVNIPQLPATGTYDITIGPYSFTGAAVTTLRTRTSLTGRALRLDDSTTAPGRLVLSGGVPAGPPAAKRTEPVTSRPSAQSGHFQAGQATGVTGDTWTPDASNLAGTDWYTHRDPSQRPAASALRGPAGSTALTGRVVTLDGKPLANVALSVEGTRTTTDAQGQFLLTGLGAGHRVLRVDGTSAGAGGRTYGLHDIGVDLAGGQTTVLGYPIWLTALDTDHVVTFASPTDREVSITTPAIPGLEVRLPAGTVVRDVNGHVVTSLGITAIPVDRAPFPLPRSQVPSYFTVQPGSSYVFPAGARVIYPNFTHASAGAKMDFWHYDPAGKGWFVYGHGTVTADGKRVEPDKGTEVYQFTGAMLITPGLDPPPAAAPTPGGGAYDADPVDLGSGLFVDRHADLTVDDVMPLAVNRTYQQSDTGRRSFGIGVNSDYDINLYSTNRFVDCWLLLPDGGRIRYHRITPGSTGAADFLDAAFQADPTPTEFNGSILAWNGDGWDLRLRNGTTYIFGDEAPLQAIRDKYGNTVTVTRAPAAADPDGVIRTKGPITQVTSPNGRWIRFTYDTSNRITRAQDNAGRAVGYTYTTGGNLQTVTDVDGGITTYTYDAAGRVQTIRDPRGNVYLTNAYDANGRVQQQTLANGGTYQLAYTTDASGKVTETRLTDPLGHVRRVQFNSAGFATSDTSAYGTANAQTTQITRNSTTNLPTTIVDSLGRSTTYTYDAFANLTGITEMAGTASARTTTIAYGGPFDQVSTLTDTLGHTTTYAYQTYGALKSVTDPLGRAVNYTIDDTGRLTKVTDAAGSSTTVAYLLGDPASLIDQLGRTSRVVFDAAGRPVALTDPTGSVARLSYDNAGNTRTVTDALGQVTTLDYDANGNLVRSTSPRGNATTYTYDTSDRLTAITDPLSRTTSAAYDAAGNLTRVTSARGKVTTIAYDELDRPTVVQYGVSGTTSESQISYSYDAGDRITSVADSTGGTGTFTYDNFDRITRAVSPQGQIDYTYDAADRRATMTVAGQPVTTYTFNNADQLTGITRGTETVGIGYDSAGRRASVTLPAGVTETYGYDAASQLTSLTYLRGSTTVGNLTYDYDAAGRPTHLDGSFARVTIPAAYGPATYDTADQQTAVAGVARTYDADGNLSNDGTTTYTWNARGELTGTAKPGLTVTYGYDGGGRRTGRTVGGVSTGFLYDGLNAVQELAGTTPTANVLSGGLDETFSVSTSGGSRSLLADQLGNTVAQADSSTLPAEYTYEPFGAVTVSGTESGDPPHFAGMRDDGNGLSNDRARYYSPSSGRFISTDPLGLNSGSTNPYTYVGNQPTDLIDPMGTKPQGSRDGKNGESCTINSFTGDTRVKMADGSTRPIDQIKPGDKVLATDPATGQTAAEPVTALIVGDGDKDLVDVSVTDTDGRDSTLTATDGHPFWVDADGSPATPGGAWIDAKDLRVGQWLKTADGKLVRVAGTHAYRQHAHVYNLTVADLHTYYVVAGDDTSVLVHNCGNKGSKTNNKANKKNKADKGDEDEDVDSEKYVTYTKTNPTTGEVYTGRSYGTGTPEQIVAARDAGHHMTAKGFGPAVLDRYRVATKAHDLRHSDPAYQAIRGREQQMIDFHGGAKSDGGTSGNAIRGAAADNPLLGTYLRAATRAFGAP